MTSRRPRILLADDYQPLLTALERMLQGECEVVGRATTVSELITQVEQCCPDVVVVDLWLPETNGIDACRKIKLTRPDVKIIIVTAADDAALRTAAIEAGASDLVPKALVHDRLLEAIRGPSSKDLPD